MSVRQAIILLFTIFPCSMGWCLETIHQAPDDFLSAWLEGSVSFSQDNHIHLGFSGTPHNPADFNPMLDRIAKLFPFDLGTPLSDARSGTRAWKDLYVLKHGSQQDRLDVLLLRGGNWKLAGSLPDATIADLGWYEGSLFVLMHPRSAPSTSTHLYCAAVSPSGSIGSPRLVALSPPGVQAEQLGVTRDGLFIAGRCAGENRRHLFCLRGLDDLSPGWSDCGEIPLSENISWDLSALGNHLLLAHPGSRTVQLCRSPRAGSAGEWISETLSGGDWNESLRRYVSTFSGHTSSYGSLVHEFHIPPRSFLQGLRLTSDQEPLPPVRWRLAKTPDSTYNDWSVVALDEYIPIQDYGEVLQYQLMNSEPGEPVSLQRVSLLWTQAAGGQAEKTQQPIPADPEKERPLPSGHSPSDQPIAAMNEALGQENEEDSADRDLHKEAFSLAQLPPPDGGFFSKLSEPSDSEKSDDNPQSQPTSTSLENLEAPLNASQGLEDPQNERGEGVDMNPLAGPPTQGRAPSDGYAQTSPPPKTFPSPTSSTDPEQESQPSVVNPSPDDTDACDPSDSLADASSPTHSAMEDAGLDRDPASSDSSESREDSPKLDRNSGPPREKDGDRQNSLEGSGRQLEGENAFNASGHPHGKMAASVFPPSATTEFAHTSALAVQPEIDPPGRFLHPTRTLLPFLLPLLVLLILAESYRATRSQAHRSSSPFRLPMTPVAWEKDRAAMSTSENQRAFQSVKAMQKTIPTGLVLPTLRKNFLPSPIGRVEWRVAEPLPEPMAPSTAFYRQGHVILVSSNGTVCQARLQADGGLCPWGVRLGHLPANSHPGNIALLENHIALLSRGNIFTASLEAGGIGEWKEVGPAPRSMGDALIVGGGDRIFFFGSRQRGRYTPLVRSVRLLSDGSMEPSQALSPLPENLNQGGVLSAHDRIYWIGGSSPQGPSKSVYSAKIDLEGSMEWQKEPDLPWPSPSPMVTTDGTRIWVTGQTSVSQRTEVACGFLDSDGHPAEWWRIDDRLPTPMTGGSFTFAGGYLLALGGWLDQDRTSQSTQVFALST